MNIISFLYVIIIICVLLLAQYLKKAKIEFIGKVGENRTLNIVQSINNSFKVMQNLFIPIANGYYTEIDTVLITDKCIFVIETKNYSGWIFGDEKSKYWMQILYQSKHQFYNPIMQNATHIRYLQNQIGSRIPIFSIIAFSNRCIFKKMDIYSDTIKVCHLNKLANIIKETNDSINYLITSEEMNNVSKKLLSFTNADEEIKKKNIEYIKKNIKDKWK